MPWGENVAAALQNGELDGLMVNLDSGYDINAHSAAPHILTSKKLWLGHIYIIAFNKNVWENLSPEIRAAIQRAAEFSYKKMGRAADKSFAAQIATLKKLGASVRILNNAELAAWENATRFAEIQDAWIAKSGGGIFKSTRAAIQAKLKGLD